jgi:cyclic pyranopterin monophosphate synthase
MPAVTRDTDSKRTRTKDKRQPTHVEPTAFGPGSRMVDVGQKPVTARSATARAVVRFPAGVLAGVLAEGGPKGPILEVARTAGILAAKRTGELIPLCHPLALDCVEVRFHPRGPRELEITCAASCTGRTGVEMEALVGAALAALTIVDMTKALDHGIAIGAVELVEKRGGRSGTWTRARAARSGGGSRTGGGARKAGGTR